LTWARREILSLSLLLGHGRLVRERKMALSRLPRLSVFIYLFINNTPFGRGKRNGMEKKKNILRIFSHFFCLEV
jgi:hypothetical protein